MIIKSMARKEPTFQQLYDYITREGDYAPEYCFTRNFILRDRENILRDFERNAKLLSKRKNGNYLYHEIISITRAKGISQKEQQELLFKIVQQYAESRAKDCLVFGGLHIEKDNNLHFHLIISANELNQRKRYRLSKQQFSEVKIGLETHVLEHHPELEQEQLISAKQKQSAKTSNKEQELKRRTGKPTQKDLFREKLQGIFAKSVDKNDFFTNLESADIECYTRGKTIGFLDRKTNKKHRLKTLGLVAEFEAVHNTIADNQQPKPQQQHGKQDDADTSEQATQNTKTKQTDQTKPNEQAKTKSAVDIEIEKRQAEITKQRVEREQENDDELSNQHTSKPTPNREPD